MNKQEILKAINATIAPNGIKGITAESLNNVLTMMTENAGEGGGSGDGALRVIVPELMLIGLELVNIGEFSPTSWEETKSAFEQSMGVDLSEYDAAVKASFEHNANVVQQILEKGKAGQGVSVVLDQTPYFPVTVNLMFQLDPYMAATYEDCAMCVVQPAAISMEYVKPIPEVEGAMDEQLFCTLNPLAPPTLSEYSILYPSNMDIVLNLDGSLTFTPIEEEQPSSGSGVVTFYMPEGSTMPASMKEKNAKAFTQYLAAEEGVSVVLQNPAKIRIIPSSVTSSDEEIVLELVTSLFSADGTVSSETVVILPDGDAVVITQ